MKKKILILFVIFTIYWGGNRLYWYINLDHNNLSMTISNRKSWYSGDSILTPMSIKLHVDDKLIYQNDTLTMPYNFVRQRMSIGCHKLTVEIDSYICKNVNFCVFPMTWMIIEYSGGDVYDNDSPILITKHLSPPRLE